MKRSTMWLACAAGLACTGSPPALADPFLTRNQHPFVQLFGLPAPLPARLPQPGTGNAILMFNWSNTAVEERRGSDSFTLDEEVVETRLVVDHAIGTRFAVHAELAYRDLSGGSLDGFIDGWHDFWGLPGGSRNRLRRDALLIRYQRGSTTEFRIDQDTTGFADIPVSAGWQWLATDTGALAAWVTIKAPTGSAKDLTGSGAADAALSFAGQRNLSEHWQVFGQADVTWLGQGDSMPGLQQDYAWSLLGGATWNPWRRLDLTVQLAANSKVFDTGLAGFDGDAVVFTFGGDYRTAGGWRFDLGISEDIEVERSPDVVFNLAFRRAF